MPVFIEGKVVMGPEKRERFLLSPVVLEQL